jgi:hypothetical protein
LTSGLQQLADRLLDEGGLLAAALTGPSPRISAGPEPDVVAEAVREGYLLHYGEGRIVRTGDADLALLGGDRCYAIGLELLAERGDLEAVGRLARLIAGGARHHAAGDPQGAERLWQEASGDAAKSA